MSAPVPLHRDPVVVEASEHAIAELAERCSTLEAAAVTTDDGFRVAGIHRAAGDENRLASMTSTTQALGEAIIRELALGDASHVAVAGTRGALLVRRIGTHPLVLVAVFAPATVDDGRVARGVARRLAHALSPAEH
jgi:predicted regulator of Ras-like GTPase activity (Roadblock/LC7/MglB family)